MRCEFSDAEWIAIKSMLPNKPRGVPRVNDRRVLNGIFWILRSGASVTFGPGAWYITVQTFASQFTCAFSKTFAAAGLSATASQVFSFSIPLCHHLLATGRFLDHASSGHGTSWQIPSAETTRRRFCRNSSAGRH